MGWRCEKCKALNNDMVDQCFNCGKSAGGGISGCLILVVIAVGLAAAIGFNAFKKKKKKKMPGGSPRPVQVRIREEE